LKPILKTLLTHSSTTCYIYIYLCVCVCYYICSHEFLMIFLLFNPNNIAIYLVQFLATSDFYSASGGERVIISPHKKLSKIDILFIKSCRLEVQTTTWSICSFFVKIIDKIHDVGAMEKKTCDTNFQLLSSKTSGCDPTWCWVEKEMGRDWSPL
jgi:hypothetical protein